MTPYPLAIIAERLTDLGRRHDQMWLCRNLLGQTVLVFREPRLTSCQAFAAFQDGRWLSTDGATIARVEVAQLISIALASVTVETVKGD